MWVKQDINIFVYFVDRFFNLLLFVFILLANDDSKGIEIYPQIKIILIFIPKKRKNSD